MLSIQWPTYFAVREAVVLAPLEYSFAQANLGLTLVSGLPACSGYDKKVDISAHPSVHAANL